MSVWYTYLIKICLIILKGDGLIKVLSDRAIDDGQWHDIQAQFNTAYIEVSVDGQKKSLRPNGHNGQNNNIGGHVELNSNLYFGGIASSKRSKAISQGVSGANHAASGTYGGLRGCIHQIELDGRKIGLPEVMETSDIQTGCVWDYPCLSKTGSPCIEGSVCFQQGTSGFRCECDDQVCTKSNSYERPNINEEKDDIDAVIFS